MYIYGGLEEETNTAYLMYENGNTLKMDVFNVECYLDFFVKSI